MRREQNYSGVASEPRIFYGWWIVAAAFVNLFVATGILFYGFPVFYPVLVSSFGFTRAQVTQGFLLGSIFLGIPFGIFTGSLIDRIGARWVILPGVGLIGISLILMGNIAKLWQYEALCLLIMAGYTLSGPIANQVLVAQWFLIISILDVKKTPARVAIWEPKEACKKDCKSMASGLGNESGEVNAAWVSDCRG